MLQRWFLCRSVLPIWSRSLDLSIWPLCLSMHGRAIAMGLRIPRCLTHASQARKPYPTLNMFKRWLIQLFAPAAVTPSPPHLEVPISLHHSASVRTFAQVAFTNSSPATQITAMTIKWTLEKRNRLLAAILAAHPKFKLVPILIHVHAYSYFKC